MNTAHPTPPLGRREFLRIAAGAGFGAFIASASDAWGLLAIDNPLASYPDRDWERVYRDLPMVP